MSNFIWEGIDIFTVVVDFRGDKSIVKYCGNYIDNFQEKGLQI